MQRLRRARPAIVNEQAYGEIRETDSILVVNGRIAWSRLNEDVVFLKLDAIAPERVLRLAQKRDLPERLWDLERLLNPEGVYSNQLITGSNACLIAWSAERDISRDNVVSAIRSCPVNPRNSIIMQRIGAEVPKAQNSGNDSRYGQNQQQRARKLTFRLAHDAPERMADPIRYILYI